MRTPLPVSCVQPTVIATTEGRARWGSNKIELRYSTVILSLIIYAKNTKTLIQEDFCTSLLIAVLFTVANIWELPSAQ